MYFRTLSLHDLHFEMRNKLSTFTRHTKSQLNLHQHVDFTAFEEKRPLSRTAFSSFAVTVLAFH